jgi:hypothetical protein
MSTIIDFTQLGGYRLEQPTLRKMQETTYLFIKAMIGHFGIPDTGKFIISGCQIAGENITEGILYIDGHICPFENAPGTLATKIIKVVTTETLVFQNATTPTVFTKYTAAVNDAGTPLTAFVRVPSPFNLPANIVIDANYVHTDNNYTTGEKNKLAGIEPGAEVNVQADWNQTNATADDFIKNKPTGELMTYLLKNTFVHGDLISTRQIVTIPFGNVGTSDYTVLGTLVGEGTWQNEAQINWVIREKTPTSFKLCMYDVSNEGAQNVTFDYVIIPNN